MANSERLGHPWVMLHCPAAVSEVWLPQVRWVQIKVTCPVLSCPVLSYSPPALAYNNWLKPLPDGFLSPWLTLTWMEFGFPSQQPAMWTRIRSFVLLDPYQNDIDK